MENRDQDVSLFFIKKTDLLENIKSIYDCLLDITCELDRCKEVINAIGEEQQELKHKIRHLRNILIKDLRLSKNVDTDVPKKTNLTAIRMTIDQWNEYINKSTSNTVFNSEDGSITGSGYDHASFHSTLNESKK